MKTLTTLTAIAALIAGMSIAAAQNAGGAAPPEASPSSINKGAGASGKMTGQSGEEANSAVKKPAKSTTGAGMPSKDDTKSPASQDAGAKPLKDK